jgi:hypothetical protein
MLTTTTTHEVSGLLYHTNWNESRRRMRINWLGKRMTRKKIGGDGEPSWVDLEHQNRWVWG